MCEERKHVTPEDRADWFRAVPLGPRVVRKEGERELVRQNYQTGEGFNRLTEYWAADARGEEWNGGK